MARSTSTATHGPASDSEITQNRVPAGTQDELQKRCETLSAQHASVKRERDDLARQIAALPRSTVEAEKAILSIRQARDTLLTRNHEIAAQVTRMEHELAELANKHDDLLGAHAKATEELTSLRANATEQTNRISALIDTESSNASALADAIRRITSLTEERDDALTRAAKLEASAEAAVVPLRSAGDEEALKIARSAAASAQRQIGQLIADREALRTQFVSEQAALLSQIAKLHAQAGIVGTETAPSEEQNAKPLARKDASLGAIQKRIAALRDDPGSLASVELLYDQFQNLAKRATTNGTAATARVASAAAELARALRKQPKKVTSSLDSFDDAFALISRLGALDDPSSIPDPTDALIYAVDDDLDNCECLAMTFEKSSLRTKYAVKPEAALADLAASKCDLVILDVDLPGMDGFALHARIRQIAHHQTTPIIFLSGMMSAAARIAELPGTNNRFVAKPYNLNDFSLKVLSMIVESRLPA